MQTTVEVTTQRAGEYAQTITVRAHELHADSIDNDTAPTPHDYFITALASCKSMTAMWYAKRHGIPLEGADARVVADDKDERTGVYRMRVEVTFRGPLSDDQRTSLTRAIAACPIHKLMTTTDVQIEMV